MNQDASKGRLEKVCVDGGMTRNKFMLQLLADILGIPVGKGSFSVSFGGSRPQFIYFLVVYQVCPKFMEMTVRGVAIAAGLAVRVWPNTSRLPSLDSDVYMATITQNGKDVILNNGRQYRARWKDLIALGPDTCPPVITVISLAS